MAHLSGNDSTPRTTAPTGGGSYRHILKYTSLFGMLQVLNMLINVIRSKAVALLLGPAGTGLINIFTNIGSLMHQATNLGLPFSAVRSVSHLQAHGSQADCQAFAHTLRQWVLFTALCGGALCLLAAVPISLFTFSSTRYVPHICLLAPYVVLLALHGGELALLKGMKRLRMVALSSLAGTVGTLVVCIACYATLGMRGVVPSLLLSQLVIYLATLRYSHRVLPLRRPRFGTGWWHEGTPMVKLGLGFIAAGILGAGTDYVISSLLNAWGGTHEVGLYRCGYIMTVTYATMIFSAIEADFFPRLSACQDEMHEASHLINRQIEVCAMLITPVLACFVTCMPLLVPLLYSSAYAAAVPMSVAALLYMFFKAHTLPAAYLPLAKGDARIYLLSEFVYDLFMMVAVPLAFVRGGLLGAGMAIAASGLLDFLFIHLFYHHRYGYTLRLQQPFYFVAQGALLVLLVAGTLAHRVGLLHLPVPLWLPSVLVCACSAGLAIHYLQRRTGIWQKIAARFHRHAKP